MARWRRSPARRVPWASRSRTEPNARGAGTRRPTGGGPRHRSVGERGSLRERHNMTKHGKKLADAAKQYDKARLHPPAEALDVVKSLATHKFDETVEAAFRLGVDPRKADQMIRGAVSLPNGTGKTVRVAVFAQGPAAQEAKDAGADVVGADDLVDRISGGFLDFDVAIATPDMMGKVGKLGRLLGPRGLMPNPKTGTVTPEVGKAVSDFKGGRIEYRTDRYGNVHMPIGKVSFTPQALVENYQAGLDELIRVKPAAAKGKYLKGVTITSTMGPGVRVDPTKTRDLVEEVKATA